MSTRGVECDVAVVGAGPAGLSAATAAASNGARVLVVDAYATAGGQYWMQPAHGRPAGGQAIEGRDAIGRAEAVGVSFLSSAEIFAAYPGFQLFANGPDGTARITCRSVVVASGAHDRTVAFPGWTLPGVMTAGGGQRLAKTQGVVPGKRIVLSGSGVFLYAVADSLLDRGAEIVALVEARRPAAALARHLARFPERWREAGGLLRRVRSRVGQVIEGRVVVEARGQKSVEAVRIARIDGSDGRDIEGIDSLLTSYGFQPQIEITSLLGCAHRFDDAMGGWHVEADPATGRTSVDGVFAAGEVTGVAGAKPAQLSGALAGFATARFLGHAVPPEATVPFARDLMRARAFGQGLGRIFAPLPELHRLAKDDTVLCRCEEVTRAQVRAGVDEGASSLYGSKLWTRAGMGRCQGRMCRMSMTLALGAATGRPLSEIGYNQPRVPARPVCISSALEALAPEGPRIVRTD